MLQLYTVFIYACESPLGVFLCVFSPPQLEFAVQMSCESCADKVRAALEGKPGEREHAEVQQRLAVWIYECTQPNMCTETVTARLMLDFICQFISLVFFYALTCTGQVVLHTFEMNSQ